MISPEKEPDSNIISAIKDGQHTPILYIYKEFREEFLKWAVRNYSITREVAKDVFQETVLDFRENVISGRYEERDSGLKTYLFQIGKFKIINTVKRDKRLTYIEDFQFIQGKEHLEFMHEENKNYTQEQLKKAIENLPEDCQKLLKLYYYDRYDMDSIAREMGYKNADTAKAKKTGCMKKLIQELKKHLLSVFI